MKISTGSIKLMKHIKPAIVSRCISTSKDRLKYGIECCKFGNPESERIIIEKSIRKGCRTIFLRGKDTNYLNYQLINDLQVTEELDWKSFLVGHIYSPSKQVRMQNKLSVTIDELLKEMNSIDKDFKIEKLGFFSVPIELLRSLSPKDMEEFSKYLRSNFMMKIGIEFSQKYLLEHAVDYANLHQIVQTLQAEYIIVSTNGITISYANELLTWAKRNKLQTVATEVLRVDRRRPGSLVFDKLTSGDVCDTRAFESSHINQIDIAKEFRGNLEKVLTLELKLLEKEAFKKLALEPNTFMLGHNIANYLSKISYPEEWEFIYLSQLKPLSEVSKNVLRSASQDTKDWSLLYGSLESSLLRSYKKMLNMRKGHACLEIAQKIKAKYGSIDNSAETWLHRFEQSKPTLDDLALQIYRITGALQVDYISSPGFEIDNQGIPKYTIDNYSRDQAVDDLSMIGEVLNHYSE